MDLDAIDADLNMNGLQLWIHGREFPNSKDYWDGNWLRTTALCRARGSRIEVSGAILHLSQLNTWLEECEILDHTLKGEAKLSHIEPNLEISLKVSHLGHIEMVVDITPDHMNQRHKYI